jgi:hypothetical protein
LFMNSVMNGIMHGITPLIIFMMIGMNEALVRVDRLKARESEVMS